MLVVRLLLQAEAANLRVKLNRRMTTARHTIQNVRDKKLSRNAVARVIVRFANDKVDVRQ